MANVQIGQASIGETGGARGNQPGNQPGHKEVNVKAWYSKNWMEVIRHADPNVGAMAATVMVKLINSNLVGYDQGDRNTLFNALKKNDWNVDKYIASREATETDCSAFCYTCYCCVVPGLRKSGYCPDTAGIWDMIHKYGGDAFQRYTDTKMLTTSDYYQVGDIINRRRKAEGGGHAMMVVSTNGTVPTTAAPNNSDFVISNDGLSGDTYSYSAGPVGVNYGASNEVYKLSTATRPYDNNILKPSDDRKGEFEALRTQMTNNAPNMGRKIYHTSELYNSNILKGDQESKTDRTWVNSLSSSSKSKESKESVPVATGTAEKEKKTETTKTDQK